MSGTNVTVDDQDPSVVYTGPDWKKEPGCPDCSAIPPDTGNIFDGTYHDGRLLTTNVGDSLTAQLTFNGTAIYVFGITINSTSPLPAVKNQDLLFSIDGGPPKEFTFVPNGPDYNYNVPFFSQGGLAPTQHSIMMSVKNNSFVLFDYFIYTQSPSSSGSSSSSIASNSNTASTTQITTASSPSPSSSSSKPPVGTIIGAVVGSLGGITIIAFLIFLIRYYRQGDHSPEAGTQNQTRPQPGTLPATNPSIGGGLTSSGVAGGAAASSANAGPSTTILSALTPGRNKNKNRSGLGAVEPFIVPPQRHPPPAVPPEKGGHGLIGTKSSSSIQRPSASIDPPSSSSAGAAGGGAANSNTSSSNRGRRRSKSRSKSNQRRATAQNPYSNAPSSNAVSNAAMNSSSAPRSDAGSAVTHPDLKEQGMKASHWKPPPPLPDVKEPIPLPSDNPSNRTPPQSRSQPRTPPPMPLPSPPAAAQPPARAPTVNGDANGGSDAQNPYEAAFKRVQNVSVGSVGSDSSGQRRIRPLPQPQPPPPAY